MHGDKMAAAHADGTKMCIRDRANAAAMAGPFTESISAFIRTNCVKSTVSVSYTHLDVYKRQPSRHSIFR